MAQHPSAIRQRKRLPHWEVGGAIYFVTFRLADSLPATVLRRLTEDRRLALEQLRSTSSGDLRLAERQVRRLLSRRIEAYLDRGSGACPLAYAGVARVVAGVLTHFDGERYELYAWCVMPNHVHVVFRPFDGFALADILHSWKSFSAQRINKNLGTHGGLWQREYFDHLLRNEPQFARAIQYVASNPIRAGLKDWKWMGVYARD